MELSIIRRETTGSPPNQYNESETITKFEIMDGAPVRGKPYELSDLLSFLGLTFILFKGKRYLYGYSSVVSILHPHSGMSTRNSAHVIT